MTSKEIVELLCELVDLKELTNRGFILKDINKFQSQLEKDLDVLEIIKEKVVDMGWVLTFNRFTDYKEKMLEIWKCSPTAYFLTQQEFSLIKEWLKDEKQRSVE